MDKTTMGKKEENDGGGDIGRKERRYGRGMVQ
jgi:hypothetical protein